MDHAEPPLFDRLCGRRANDFRADAPHLAGRPDGNDWQGNEDGVQRLLGKLARLTR
jgi:hypothetical protein